MKKRVFALIGGIASGKSAASAILASLGAYIIDADVISHEIARPCSIGEKKLLERFPNCETDGRLDRKKLKAHVFEDEAELKALNRITHPLILGEIDRLVSLAEGVAVVVMPLPTRLRRYNAVLNVFCPSELRIERLMKRDNIDRALAEKIMASQPSEEQYHKAADFTFVNDGDLSKLHDAIKKWWDIYVENEDGDNIRSGGDDRDGDLCRP